jgi:cytochrome P450
MIDLTRPINLSSPEFVQNKFEWFERIREEKPVYLAKISVLKIYTVSRYEDCTNILKDPRVLRNRSTVTGGSRFPFPLPKSIQVIAESMITEDDPNHRRLRELVRRAFRPQAVAALTEKIDLYSHELLDELEQREHFDLQTDYALKIPVRMIGDMLGIARDDMPKFIDTFGVLTEGFSGWRLVRTLFKDMPQSVAFVRQLIRAKAKSPADDILSHLIQTEDNGDRLTEDELVAMVFLLIVAGYETTVHLISNGVLTLLQHPLQLEQLRAEPSLIDSAVEEILRHRGPVQGTKPGYAVEDISLHGVTIPKGKPIMPLFGAANHDPRVFDDPLTFDITRTPNRHLGFGHGMHFCLGAHLARAEARLGLLNLIQRLPNLRLAVDESALELQPLPGWHRYNGLPVATGHAKRTAV